MEFEECYERRVPVEIGGREVPFIALDDLRRDKRAAGRHLKPDRMCRTCDSVDHMSKMIQIRNVPDDLHREAKARAARAGMTLSDFLLREVRRALSTPPIEELLGRRQRRGRVEVDEDPAAAVRAERDAR